MRASSSRSSSRGPIRSLASACLAAGALAFAPAEAQDVEEKPHKRVLILHSLGPNFSPFDEFAAGIQRDLRQRAPSRVEFFEMSLASARIEASASDEPFAEYLSTVFRDHPLDLVISIGGPAARFCLRHRDGLLSSTPLLTTGLERRVLGAAPLAARAAALVVVLDLPGQIDHILRVLPRTERIAVITGSAGLGRLWFDELQREFAPFSDRVQFEWFFDLPLVEIEERVAELPPDSVIFYGGLTLDAAGVPYERNEALDVLYASANAPIFGLFDVELGRGIVGGPLVSVAEASRRASDAALRILGGEALETVTIEPVTMGSPVYDHQELVRWGIPESRLPPGSSVRFRTPSAWAQYRSVILGAVAIVSLQTALIAGLLVQRSRRRSAEKQGRDLGRRLLTAHEDERRRLARELHDDLSQRLARLAIDAARMERTRTAAPGEVSDRSMREELVRLSEDVHALSYQLHPSIIDDLGLREALDAECARFTRSEGVAAKLDSVGLPDSLSPDASLCLFRVAQEALTNVSRHARASRVSVSVGPSDGGVRLVVSDDGGGFSGNEHRGHRSLGLASMKERVDLVDGKLEIESRPGAGTTVSVWVPARLRRDSGIAPKGLMSRKPQR